MFLFINVSIGFSLAWVIWEIYKSYKEKNLVWKRDNKGIDVKKELNHLDDDDFRLGFIIVWGVIITIISSFFTSSYITSNIVKKVVEAQYSNCDSSTTKDGDFLTTKQCQYFRDVLNGKYSEHENSLFGEEDTIRSYLGEE